MAGAPRPHVKQAGGNTDTQTKQRNRAGAGSYEQMTSIPCRPASVVSRMSRRSSEWTRRYPIDVIDSLKLTVTYVMSDASMHPVRHVPLTYDPDFVIGFLRLQRASSCPSPPSCSHLRNQWGINGGSRKSLSDLRFQFLDRSRTCIPFKSDYAMFYTSTSEGADGKWPTGPHETRRN